MRGHTPPEERHLVIIDETDDIQDVIVLLVRGLKVVNSPDDDRDDQDGAS